MRTIFSFLFIGILINTYSQDRGKIDYPELLFNNSMALEVYHLENTDTAFVVRGGIYNKPGNWVKLSSNIIVKGKRKKYRLLSSPDFQLDSMVYLPESGALPLTLFFEPLKKKEKTVDLIENPKGEGLRLEGISLLPPAEKRMACTVKGEILNRPDSKRLMLMRRGADPKVDGFISIPVDDEGKFLYKLRVDVSELYEIVLWEEWLADDWEPFSFIAESGELNFKIYPRKDSLNYQLETDAPLNAKFAFFAHRPQCEELLDYARKDSTLLGYSLLMTVLDHLPDDSPLEVEVVDLYNDLYNPLFPNHPYSEELEDIALNYVLREGNNYIDFTLPDLSGDSVSLSSLIEGKIALIDLWAPWCAPCRKVSKSLVPLYNRYKEKGWVVVGVARERKNTRAMQKAIEQDGYPWTNLVELDDEKQIWQKYGVGDAGGAIFLVGKDGKILAIDPSPEELQVLLKELFVDEENLND